MKLIFKYDLEKEYINLHCGLGSLNHPGQIPKTAQEILDCGIKLDDKPNILSFFNRKMIEKKINLKKRLSEISQDWNKVENKVDKRLKSLFNTDMDLGEITVFLTVSMRCGYNLKNKFFFLTIDRKYPRATIIHELMHFYTYYLYEEKFKIKGLSFEEFNDYKEAITFIINTNFKDVIGDFTEEGYEKQYSLRNSLQKKWPDCKNISDLTDYYLQNTIG